MPAAGFLIGGTIPAAMTMSRVVRDPGPLALPLVVPRDPAVVAAAVPPTLDLIVQQGLAPGESVATDRTLLDAVASRALVATGALRVYTLAGDVLAIGRFHAAPRPRPEGGIRVMRRWSGGRAMPWGEGFVGISLVLPHRSALVSAHPEALAPAQVMNRCVRGILAACEDAGVPAFYPGRDLLTVERRLLGMVSFAVEEGGALVFEAVIANGADASVLPRLLDRADPHGVVPCAMLTAADATSLAARLGAPLALADLGARIARGYEERLGVRCVTVKAPAPAAFDETAWLDRRRRRDDLERCFSIASQLGVIEVRFARDDERVLDIVIGGDVIAPAATIERLEAALRGCPVARERLGAAIRTVFREPAHFILGAGTPDAFADAITGGIVA